MNSQCVQSKRKKKQNTQTNKQITVSCPCCSFRFKVTVPTPHSDYNGNSSQINHRNSPSKVEQNIDAKMLRLHTQSMREEGLPLSERELIESLKEKSISRLGKLQLLNKISSIKRNVQHDISGQIINQNINEKQQSPETNDKISKQNKQIEEKSCKDILFRKQIQQILGLLLQWLQHKKLMSELPSHLKMFLADSKNQIQIS